MLSFIKRVGLFLLFPLLLLLTGIFLPTYPAEESSYFFARIDKDNLLKNTPSPRIIFVGGSNWAMGMNSQLVKDSLGINPINTGLDCNIGLTYWVQNIMEYAKSGDVIVIALEYEAYLGSNLYGGYPSPIIVFNISPHYLSKLSLGQWTTLLRRTPGYAFRRLKVWKYFSADEGLNNGYSDRTSFNQYGDYTIHWKETQTAHPKPVTNMEGAINPESIALLIKLNKWLNEKKAILYVSFPPYQTSSFEYNKITINKVEKALQESGLTIIGSAQRYRMPEEMIYNSPYHLIKKGLDHRAALLIEDLKKANEQTSIK